MYLDYATRLSTIFFQETGVVDLASTLKSYTDE